MLRFPSSHQAVSPGLPSRPSLPNHHPEHGRELISYFPQGHKQHGKRKKLFSFNRHSLPSGSGALAPPLRITLELSTLIMYCLS